MNFSNFHHANHLITKIIVQTMNVLNHDWNDYLMGYELFELSSCQSFNHKNHSSDNECLEP